MKEVRQSLSTMLFLHVALQESQSADYLIFYVEHLDSLLDNNAIADSASTCYCQYCVRGQCSYRFSDEFPNGYLRKLIDQYDVWELQSIFVNTIYWLLRKLPFHSVRSAIVSSRAVAAIGDLVHFYPGAVFHTYTDRDELRTPSDILFREIYTTESSHKSYRVGQIWLGCLQRAGIDLQEYFAFYTIRGALY